MLDNQCRLLLKYEGEALSNHSMDVAQLAPSLLALNDAIQELNRQINGDQAKVTLKIDAPAKAGSIGIDLSLAQDFLSQVTGFLTSGGISAVCNAHTLVTCFLQIIMLKKYLKGRDPTLFIESKDETKTVLVIEQRRIVVNNFAIAGLANQVCTNACSRLADPLRNEGISEFSLSTEHEIESVKKEELEGFQAIQEERELTRFTRKVAAIVESVAFKDEAKWKLNLGDKNSIFASIKDEQFLKAIDSGAELFGKGDCLLAEIESVQTATPEGRIKMSHSVTKVYEHKHAMEQISLFETL